MSEFAQTNAKRNFFVSINYLSLYKITLIGNKTILPICPPTDRCHPPHRPVPHPFIPLPQVDTAQRLRLRFSNPQHTPLSPTTAPSSQSTHRPLLRLHFISISSLLHAYSSSIQYLLHSFPLFNSQLTPFTRASFPHFYHPSSLTNDPALTHPLPTQVSFHHITMSKSTVLPISANSSLQANHRPQHNSPQKSSAICRPRRLPTALVACIFNATCSTSLTLANKHIFSVNFNHPWSLLGIQSSIVTLLLMTFQLSRRQRSISISLLKQMFLPCILFTSYIFTNARALNYVSLPILSVLKSLAPLGIAVFERLIFGDPITGGVAAAMGLIIFGNAITMFNDVEYSASGYGWAIANVVINIAYVLSLRLCLSDKYTPIEKTLHSNLIAACILLPIAHLTGESETFIPAFEATPQLFRNVYFFSCILAALIGASIFWVVQATSGSTLSFIGACNKFNLVILSGIIYKDHISFPGWVSVFFGILAGVVFTYAKTRTAMAETPKDKLKNDMMSDIGEVVEFISSDDDDEGADLIRKG